MIKLLIVDDDELFAHMLTERLVRELDPTQFTVEPVTTGEAAKTLINDRAQPIDIVLIDQRLGAGMSGLDFLAWLQANYPQIDSVLFTGLDDADIGLRAYELGAFRYLVKPFDPRELVWIVQALLQKRAVHYERNWLTVLNHVGAKLHQVTTLEDVGNALVSGGIELGYERAKLYVVHEDDAGQIFFQGFQQAGSELIANFDQIEIPYQESEHHRLVYDAKALKFFDGQRAGKGYMVRKLGLVNSPPAIGEWVCIPLLHQQCCVATLVLDNPSQAKPLRQEERELLHLFAQQASAAWERALVHAERALEQTASAIAHRIIERTSNDGSPGDLNAFLQVIYQELNQITPTKDFVVVMKHQDPEIDARGWLRYCLHIKDGCSPVAYWRPPTERSLIYYVIHHEQKPLYWRKTTLEYRRQHKIHPPKKNVVQSMIGIPLCVGEETIGGIFIEDYTQTDRWTQAQFDLCSRVVSQLAHYLQSTWINQQRTQLNNQLGDLPVANEKIMGLAQQQPEHLPEDEWLWHATLTVATAQYGFGFNRAFLFLTEEGGASLRGRMAIGQLTVDEAKQAWREDHKKGLTNFDAYIDCLQKGQLQLSTPADRQIRSLTLAVQTHTVFAEVLGLGKIINVSAQEATASLPAPFVKIFGVHDYWLLPVKVGNRAIGLVILDNFCNTEPPQTFALKYLDALTNEAALIQENLRRSRVQQHLLDLNRVVLTHANQLPLRVTLSKIVRAARLTTGADSVAIYPLDPISDLHRLDLAHFIWYEGTKDPGTPPHTVLPSTFMLHVLDSLQPLKVTDIDQSHPSGLNFADDPVVKQKGICAFICIPIRDHYNGRARGLLYINYRWPRPFERHEIEEAEAFANLVAMALKSWRDHQGLRIQKEGREEELYSLLEILQTALQPEIEESQLIATLLRVTKDLFNLYDPKVNLHIKLFLKAWKRLDKSSVDPIEIRHQYYLNPNGYFDVQERQKIQGLTALALQKAEPIRVGDVCRPPWNEIYHAFHAQTRSELDVPILGEDKVPIGVLNIETDQSYYFTEIHEKMIERLTRVAVLALDSIRRRKHLRALLIAGQAITVQRELRHTLAIVASELLKILPDLSIMTVWYISPPDDRLLLGTHIGIRDEQQLKLEHPRPQGAVQAIMDRAGPLWAEDVTAYPFFVNSNFIAREAVRSTAAFPLIVSGMTIGAIFYAYRQAHCFTKSERELLTTLTQYIAIGINDAQLIETATKEKNRLQSVLQVTEAVGATLDLQQIIKRARTVLYELYPAARSLFFFYNRSANTLELSDDPESPYHLDPAGRPALLTIPMNETSMMGKLALLAQQQKRQARMLYRNLQERGEQPYLHLRQEARSAMGISYINTRGELLGGLLLESDDVNAFSQDDLPLLEGIARQLALTVERSQQSAALDFRNIVTDSMLWAADLAHDLNCEIYHIRSWLQALRDEQAAFSESAQNAVAEIEDSFNRIVRDAPWSNQEVRQIDDLQVTLAEWLQEYIGPYGEQTTVIWSADTPKIFIRTDIAVLRRIIRHLVRNALRAMHYKGKLWIELRHIDEYQIRIQMTDSGSGIGNDDPLRERLFHEPIADRSRGGLGLLFARLLIEKLNGHIHLSEFIEGQGATFCIDLPVEPLV